MKLAFLLIALLAPPAFAQSDLPTIGTLDEIKGKTKFYVVANTDDRDKIVKVLKKRPELVVVGEPDDAEFFIEYRETSRDEKMMMTMARGQMDVYVIREKKKVIAWTDSASGGGFKSAVAGELAGKLENALKEKKLT